MGIDLTGKTVSSTYDGLIKTTDNQPITDTAKILTDGFGNDSAVKLGKQTIELVTGKTANLTAGTTLVAAPSADNHATTRLYVDSADTTLQTNIDNEESARITADAAIQTQVDTNTSDITALENAVSDISTDVATNTTNIANNAANIASNDTDIAANASAIADLENGVGNVTSFNTLVGDVTISAGNNITFNTVGNDIEINSTGGGGGGSDSFNTFTVPSQPDVVAASGNDTMNFVDGDGISMTTNNTTKTITFNVDGLGSTTLTQNFVWVGDASNVPQEVAVSSLGSTTINNNANNRIITGSDTANTLEGESKLLFDSSGLKVVSSNNDTAYLQINGGALGASAPTISAPNFGTIGLDTNVYLTGQNKIAFDSDTLNTYIAADVADPESLEIHADAKVKIWADDGFEVWEPIASPSKMFSVLPDATGTQPRVTIGADANADYHFQNFGITRINKLHYDDGYASAGRAEGQVIYVGSDATSVGRIYVLTNTGWVTADSSNCTGLLGVALGINSNLGMIISGTAALPSGTQTLGRELYLNSSGAVTSNVPTGSGEIVRKIGYSLGGVTYTFTPSMDYITLV